MQIQGAYVQRQLFDALADPKYIDTGAIFEIMAYTVVEQHLAAV
jgi:type I restriction enzyme, R subunit